MSEEMYVNGICHCGKIKITAQIEIADSGNKRIQAFCSECGTQLYATDVDKRNYNLRTGFLEQKNELKPLHHVFTNSWMSWIRNIDF